MLRAADAGADTYLYWVRLDRPERPLVHVVRRSDAAGLLRRLHDAVAGGKVTDRLAREAFATPEQESHLCAGLGAAVLPPELVEELCRGGVDGPALLRVTPSPRLAGLPWELLVLPDGSRVIERAQVRHDPPATLYAARSSSPGPRVRDGGVVRVIDPEVPGELPVLAPDAEVERLRAVWPSAAIRTPVSRADLGESLRRHPARLVYVGHVTSRGDDPAATALHLTDRADVYGLAPLTAAGHRPLAAVDLLRGTTEVVRRDRATRYPHDGDLPGHRIWPMPPRVGLIACASGADHGAIETFGLVIAMLDAGAEVLTATRWVLPTDAALRRVAGDQRWRPTIGPLAEQVDAAHAMADPFAAIRAWQLAQLSEWTATGSVWHSPLVWASLATHHAPA